MEAPAWVLILVALIGAVPGTIGALAGIYALYLQRRKVKTDSVDVFTEAATRLIGPLNERMDEMVRQNAALQARVSELEREVETLKQAIDQKDSMIKRLQSGLRLLVLQVKSLGAEPVFHLPEEE